MPILVFESIGAGGVGLLCVRVGEELQSIQDSIIQGTGSSYHWLRGEEPVATNRYPPAFDAAAP